MYVGQKHRKTTVVKFAGKEGGPFSPAEQN